METETKKALVCGAGGFIGSHMVKKLKSEGYWVRGADVKEPDFSGTEADEFLTGDLTDQSFCKDVTNIEFDEIYQMAVGKGAPAYSFLTILPHSQDESKMFMARFDQRLSVDSDEED